jgi:hypothetical protein
MGARTHLEVLSFLIGCSQRFGGYYPGGVWEFPRYLTPLWRRANDDYSDKPVSYSILET